MKYSSEVEEWRREGRQRLFIFECLNLLLMDGLRFLVRFGLAWCVSRAWGFLIGGRWGKLISGDYDWFSLDLCQVIFDSEVDGRRHFAVFFIGRGFVCW